MKHIVLLTILLLTTITHSQITNIRLSSTSSNDPEEVAIAINPNNPNQLAAGANIAYLYYSNNGGLNWTQKVMSSTLGVWGDPCLIYDGLGYLYFAHLSNPLQGYWIDRIVVQRSTDNGLTWNDGAGIGYNSPKNQDKEWLAVNLSDSPYKNHIYTTWTEFDDYGSSSPNDSSRILFSKSTDHGLTWSPTVKVSDRSGNCIDSDNTVEGAVPAIGPNGEIYVSWSGPLGIMFDKSTDGGNSFGVDKFVTTQPGGWDFDVPGINRCNGLPVTACDTSNSPFRGNIYIMWGDQRSGTSDTDVFLIKSTDGGNTWGEVKRVNDDATTRHQFFPWMAIDQTTGILYFIFYDRRNTTGSATDVFVARSRDGGETFENFKVSQSSFTPNAGIFFGDYSNIAAYNRKVYPLWMRMDGTALSVWTAPFVDTATVLPVELLSFQVISEENFIKLTWQTASELNNKGFEIQRSGDRINWTSIGFINGKGTTTSVTDYSFTDRPDGDGEYLYRLKQVDFSGVFAYSDIVSVNFIGEPEIALFQNYPNPFNLSTTIGFRLPKTAFVSIKIFDVLGNLVSEIVSKEFPAGNHEVEFSAEEIPSGVYVYYLQAGEVKLSKRMILLR